MSSSRPHTILTVASLNAAADGVKLLSGVELSVACGEFVAVAGRNGAGKSTLFKSLIGLIQSRGELCCCGRDLYTLAVRERAKLIAYVPQHVEVPLGLSAYDFIALGRHPQRGPFSPWSDDDAAAVAGAIERCGVGAYLHRALASLSGGERQRVFLAAAIAQGPQVLLLDEPTTALDPVQRDHVWDLLDDLRRSKSLAVLASTHDVESAARVVDRFIALKDGRIIWSGAPKEFLAPHRFAEVYGERPAVLGETRL